MNASEPPKELSNTIPPPRKRRRMPIRTALLLLALLLTFAAVPFHSLIASWILESGTLSNDSPTIALVREMIESSPHPEAALLSAWRTGKIVHRRAAILALKNIVAGTHSLSPKLEPMVLAATLDADLDVREDAFGVLRRCKHPALAPLASIQLQDCDPEARLLGLECLKWVSADISIPTAIPLLDDPDPLVAGNCTCLLGIWAHQNFGVKLSEIAPGALDEKSGMRDLRENARTKAEAATGRARTWWAMHRSEFAFSNSRPRAAISASPHPFVAVDFEAPALDGHSVRLSDLRGKNVLLYFWTVACPGGVGQLQDLVKLQQKAGSRLAIIGVSLDNVLDDDGDLGGDDTGEQPDAHGKENPSPAEVQKKVARIVNGLGVNYTVMLDRNFFVGGRFNAVDLPTTVIIDSQGFVRRKIVGRRTLPVLEAMLAETGHSVNVSIK